MVAEGLKAEACAVVGALMDASERTRLGSGVRCTMAPLEEHPFFTSEPAWAWEALSTGAYSKGGGRGGHCSELVGGGLCCSVAP